MWAGGRPPPGGRGGKCSRGGSGGAWAAAPAPQAPAVGTTSAEREWFGHEAGRMVGRAIDEHLAARQADEHFQEASCPTCGASGESDVVESTKTRPLQTLDGKILLAERVFRCPTCCRDFFPSEDRVGD